MVQIRWRAVSTAIAFSFLLLALPGPNAAEAASSDALKPSGQTTSERPSPAPVPAPTPWPPMIQVFEDDFESPRTYATYSGLGGANVYIANGRLNVDIPSDARGSGGLRMRLPPGGTGVRCSGFKGLAVPSLGSGSMHWKLIGFDAANGGEVVLLELFMTEGFGKQDPFLSFRYEKDGKGKYAHVTTNKTADKIDKIQWDTKDGGKKVQAEITFKDGTKASSPWIDPEESTIAGFDITTDAPEFSADAAAGEEVHAEGDAPPNEPAPIERFATAELTNLYPYWLVQAHDADAVVVATVARIGKVRKTRFDGDRRLRLAVHYFLDETLYGDPGADKLTVYHGLNGDDDVKKFSPGTRLLLFIKSSEKGHWDFGEPAGVIPGDYQNYQAVASRVDLIHGGGAP